MTDEEQSRVLQYALRLPASLKNVAQRIADENSVSLSRFIRIAILEKIERAASSRGAEPDK